MSLTTSRGTTLTSEVALEEYGGEAEWKLPNESNLAKFSKDAVSPQEAIINWGIAESGKATGKGITIAVRLLVGTKLGTHLD